MRHEQRFDKVISSLDGVFAFLGGCLEGEEIGDNVNFSLNLALEEIFANMVKHNKSSRNEVLVGIERTGDHVVVELTDFDVEPFDPEAVAEVDIEAPLEERRPGGLGLHLVKSMVDKLTYEYRDRDLKVTLYKYLES